MKAWIRLKKRMHARERFGRLLIKLQDAESRENEEYHHILNTLPKDSKSSPIILQRYNSSLKYLRRLERLSKIKISSEFSYLPYLIRETEHFVRGRAEAYKQIAYLEELKDVVDGIDAEGEDWKWQ